MINLLLFLVAFNSQTVQPVFTPPDVRMLQTGIRLLYETRFHEADSIFLSYQKANPDRPEGFFLSSMVWWWKVQLGKTSRQFQPGFLKSMANTLSEVDRIRDRKPELTALCDFYEAGCYGFIARLHIHNREWTSAATNGVRAYPVLRKLLSNAGFPDARFGTGIYQYYASWVPERFPFLKPFLVMMPPATREEGLKDLQIAARDGLLTHTESSYFMLQIAMDYEQDHPRALALSDSLFRRYPSNPLFHLAHIQNLLNSDRIQESNQLLSNFAAAAQHSDWHRMFQSPKYWYIAGKVLLASGNAVGAESAFRNATSVTDPQIRDEFDEYINGALVETGWIQYRQGRKTQARFTWQQAANGSSDYWKEQAENALNQ